MRRLVKKSCTVFDINIAHRVVILVSFGSLFGAETQTKAPHDKIVRIFYDEATLRQAMTH